MNINETININGIDYKVVSTSVTYSLFTGKKMYLIGLINDEGEFIYILDHPNESDKEPE